VVGSSNLVLAISPFKPSGVVYHAPITVGGKKNDEDLPANINTTGYVMN